MSMNSPNFFKSFLVHHRKLGMTRLTVSFSTGVRFAALRGKCVGASFFKLASIVLRSGAGFPGGVPRKRQ